MSDNRLKIEADALELELSGDADYVIRAYEAIRPVAMEQFEQTLARREQDDKRTTDVWEPEQTLGKERTDPQFGPDADAQHIKASKQLMASGIQLVVCTAMYRRFAVLERKDFRSSIFGDTIDPTPVNKVYLGEEVASRLREEMEFGRTLWRELTKAGQAVVHGDSP